jgi:hypothetical protein
MLDEVPPCYSAEGISNEIQFSGTGDEENLRTASWVPWRWRPRRWERRCSSAPFSPRGPAGAEEPNRRSGRSRQRPSPVLSSSLGMLRFARRDAGLGGGGSPSRLDGLGAQSRGRARSQPHVPGEPSEERNPANFFFFKSGSVVVIYVH